MSQINVEHVCTMIANELPTRYSSYAVATGKKGGKVLLVSYEYLSSYEGAVEVLNTGNYTFDVTVTKIAHRVQDVPAGEYEVYQCTEVTCTETLKKKIDALEYDSTDPYPTKQTVSNSADLQEARLAWRHKSSLKTARFHEDICTLFIRAGATPKAAKIAEAYCWDHGHDSGYREVLVHVDEMLDIFEAMKR